MGAREILILGLCCAAVIALIGLPISYFSRRLFAPSATPLSPLIFAAIGFILSQGVLFSVTLGFISMNGGNAFDSTIDILYIREWRTLTAAFAITGAVIGALSLINKNAEQDGAEQPATRSDSK